MKIIGAEKLNEKFGGNDVGVAIGYGERGLKFYEVECDSLTDFHENAELGQCWTDEDNVTYYKIRNEQDDAVAFSLDEDGDIITV